MSNESKAKEIAQTRSEHLDEYDLCYEAAMKMAKLKDDATKEIIIKLKNRTNGCAALPKVNRRLNLFKYEQIYWLF